MIDWRRTVWGRFPIVLARPSVYRSLAVTLFLAAGLPTLYVAWQGDALIGPLTAFGVRTWFDLPDSRALFEGLSPELRAAFPQRLERLVRRVMPTLIVAGALTAIAGAWACLVGGRFLQRHGQNLRNETVEFAPHLERAARPGEARWGPLLAALAGFLAHLPFLTHSFDLDESAAALHLSRSWFAWASTWQGWEVHMGGEFLGRLAYAVAGFNDLWMRVPTALLSAAGLGIAYRWTERRYGPLAAWLTVGMLCALPLWAEQTAHLRGYGMLFLAGAWNMTVLWDLLDGPEPGRETRLLAALVVSLAIGALAHAFFLFYGAAVLLLMAWHGRSTRNPVAIAGLAWGAAALVPAGLLYFPGLPATIYQTIALGQIDPIGAYLAGLFPTMVGDLGFGNTAVSMAIATAFLALWLMGLSHLEPDQRWRVLVVLTVSMGVPLAMRPVFLGDRFFVHLLPLAFVAALPLAGWLRHIRSSAMRSSLAATGIMALWAFPAPYSRLPLVDLRGASDALVRLARPGDRILLDNAFVSGRVYVPDHLNARYVNMGRSLPEADMLMFCRDCGKQPPSGYVEIAVVPGADMTVVIYRDGIAE